MNANKIKTIRQYNLKLSLNCKIPAIWLVDRACKFLMFLIATVQISMECETQESKARCAKHLNYTNLKHTCAGIG